MEEDTEWEVEEVLQRGRINSITHYLVKWKGYPKEEATWEPITNLDNCQEQIMKFQRSIKTPKPRGRRKKRNPFDLQKIFGKDLELAQPLKTECQQSRENLQKIECSTKQSQKKYEKAQVQLIPSEKHKLDFDDQQLNIVSVVRACKKSKRINRKEISTDSQFIKLIDSNTPQQSRQKQLPSIKRRIPINTNNLMEQNDLVECIQPLPAKRIKLEEPISIRGINQSQQKNSNQSKYNIKPDITQNINQQQKFDKLSKIFDKQTSFIVTAKIQQQQSHQISSHQPDPKVTSNNPENLQGNQSLQVLYPTQYKVEYQIQQIVISQSIKLISLLCGQREIKCDQILRKKQRQLLGSIITKDPPSSSSSNLPVLDLSDCPQLLEQLGPICILTEQKSKVEDTIALVRLRHGWAVIGHADGSLSLAGVSKLDDQCWTKTLQKYGDCM